MPAKKTASPSQRACMLPSPRAAFSLIELLVAIAVIAILASILIPAMSGARERSMMATSISNLRQSASFLLMHAASNNNILEIKSAGSGGADKIWSVAVAEMVVPGMTSRITNEKLRIPALDIMVSPAYYPFRHDPAVANWQWSTYGFFAISTGSYASSQIVDTGNGSYGLFSVNLAAADNLSNIPMLMDSVQTSQNPPNQRMSIRSWTAAPSGGSVHLRHDGKALAVFLDGSARALDVESLKEIGFRSAYDKDLNLVSF